MNIFSDCSHHGELWDSFKILFEKRLGYDLSTPYGMDWFDSGNWLIGAPYGEGARNTAIQFLASGQPTDGTAVIYPHGPMTFAEFVSTPIDIMIATYFPHIEVYDRLIKQYHPNAKLIAQYGNCWEYHPLARNLMLSTEKIETPPGINLVYYHPPFEKADFEAYNAPSPGEKRQICSFVNALPQNDIFTKDLQDYMKLRMLMSDYSFRSYGGGCFDGSLSQREVARKMKESQWIVHFKSGGDGYGFVIHKGFYAGTPFIYKGSQYVGKLAGKLLEHGVTGIDVEKIGIDNVSSFIHSISNEEYLEYRRRVRERFNETVDFNQETKKIKSFLENLQ